MQDGSEGYVTGIDYTIDCYTELNPLSATLPLLKAGIAPPGRVTGACCELGFGFGLSANMHAAASEASWWGTDFNPTQAGFAQDIARISGADAHLFDQSFAEFCHRSDLPDFDFIGLHGVWTWVSDDNRRLIVDFIRRRLRVGGLVYISYNTQPGWAQMLPLRQLLIEHAETLSPRGAPLEHRIKAAIAQVRALIESSPGYAAMHPAAASRIKSLDQHPVNYLAHEYFNRDWQPMLFSEFARWLEPSKLSFACSAKATDAFDRFNLLSGQAELLKQLPDPGFRESARDMLVNRLFRKDYWVKGPQRLEPAVQREALSAQRLMLIRAPATITLQEGGLLNPMPLDPAVYIPVIDSLADGQPHRLADLVAQLPSLNFGQILEAVMVMTGRGDAVLVQDEASLTRVKPRTQRLNQHIIQASTQSGQVHYLASPVTGGAVLTQPFHLQILAARQEGLSTPEQIAPFLQQLLAAKGAGITRPDGSMMGMQESLNAITQMVRDFEQTRLPYLQALQVAD